MKKNNNHRRCCSTSNRTASSSSNRARHRLLSIRHDVETFVRPTVLEQQQHYRNPLVVIANERCGSWYVYPLAVAVEQQQRQQQQRRRSCHEQKNANNHTNTNTTNNKKQRHPYGYHSCYFKSTDGHVGTWNVSWKRLNLNVINLVARGSSSSCYQNGTVIIVDSSVRKEMPDSFSRTIPLWCTCMNRIAERYRKELGLSLPSKRKFTERSSSHNNNNNTDYDWDDKLYTPEWIVPRNEHATMEALIDDRVNALYQGKVIVNPYWLVTTLTKPLRPFWITPQRNNTDVLQSTDDDCDYYAIVCLNASSQEQRQQFSSSQQLHHPTTGTKVWMNDETKTTTTNASSSCSSCASSSFGYYNYTQGAADDEDTWSRNLTPQLFWDNVRDLLLMQHTNDNDDDDDDYDDVVDQRIDSLVKRHQNDDDDMHTNNNTPARRASADSNDDAKKEPSVLRQRHAGFDFIGRNTNLAIGTRRAGRPPECWQYFDAILNVTDMEYPTIHDACCCGNNSYSVHNDSLHDNSNKKGSNDDAGSKQCEGGNRCKFYLQLPVREGKRDKTELERWMAVGIIFCLAHVQGERRVLIHCAQGKDRSVAVAVATIVLFCDLTLPLQWREDVYSLSISKLLDESTTAVEKHPNDECFYKSSGLSEKLVRSLQGREGRDRLLSWLRNARKTDRAVESHNVEDDDGVDVEQPLATKETLRIALHLVRQDREKAEPTRSTMQKLNRFFMSAIYQKSNA